MINTIAPSMTPTSVLIADTYNAPDGSVDSIPKMTVINGQTVTAALEVQSTQGGFLPPRMTTAQRDEMVVDNGMMIYNISTNDYNIYVGGIWKSITTSGGSSPPTTVDDIATFSDTHGTIKDSGVSIVQVPPLLVNPAISSPGNTNTISNLSYVQFLSGSGYVFLADRAGIQLFRQPSPQNICTVITDGSIPPSPSSASCALEINTRSGAFLLSRMSQANVDSLVNPQDGMLLFNADTGKFQGREGGSWEDLVTSTNGGVVEKVTIITGSYDVLDSDSVIMSNVPTFSPIIAFPENPVIGQAYRIFDYSGTAGTFSINFDGNGKSINGLSTGPYNLENVTVANTPVSLAITNNNFVYSVNNVGSPSVVIYNNVNSELTTITHSSFNSPTKIAITPNQNYAYIVNSGSSSGTNGVTVIQNASSTSPLPSVLPVSLTTQPGPSAIAITPNGNFAFVTGFISSQVTVLQNVSTNAPSFATTLSSNFSGPIDVAVTPDGSRAYILNQDGVPLMGGSVIYYNGASSGLPSFGGILLGPNGGSGDNGTKISISPNGNYLYGCFGTNNTVIVYGSITTGTPSEVFRFSTTRPTGAVFSPNGNYVYIVNSTSNTVTVVKNASSNSPIVLKTITVGNGPGDVAFSPDGHYAFVTIFNGGSGNSVVVIEDASSDNCSVLNTVTTALGSNAIAVTSNGDYAYVANQNNISMSIIANASGFRAITTNYGSSYLIYNGTQWNSVQSLAT